MYLNFLKILPVTRSKVPKAAILSLKILTGNRLWFCKILPEGTCDKLTLAHFPCSQWEDGIREHRPFREKGIVMKVSVPVNIYKISTVSYFKEANKKLIIIQGSEKLLKDLENHRRTHRKYWLTLFYTQHG